MKILHAAALLAALVSFGAGCGGSDDAGDTLDGEADVDSDSAEISSAYNRPIRSHHGVDVKLRAASTPLLDREGNPLGPIASAYRPGGKIRIQGNEAVKRSGKEALYYMWGDAPIESGFLPRSALASTPSINGEDGGNGQVAPSNCKRYKIHPQAIPSDLRFERHDGKDPSTLATYGTPGAPAFANYTTLQWNVVTVDGGGLIRSILKEGETFYGAKVKRIVVHSVASKGYVEFMYGFAFQSGKRVYGWTVVSHVANGSLTYHAKLESTKDCK
jgi:hypothetical protein